MPPQLPQSYMFKLLYYNRNPIAMDVPLLIDEDGVFFFSWSSYIIPSIISHGTSNLSKLDDDDVVMFFRNFVTPLPPSRKRFI